MADNNIEDAKPKEGQAVDSVTEETPHPADADSSPGPYEGLEVNRPPVSTNEPTTPIAHSLVGGAGAPSPQETPPEEMTPDSPEVNPTEEQSDDAPKRGRPAKAAEDK